MRENRLGPGGNLLKGLGDVEDARSVRRADDDGSRGVSCVNWAEYWRREHGWGLLYCNHWCWMSAGMVGGGKSAAGLRSAATGETMENEAVK